MRRFMSGMLALCGAALVLGCGESRPQAVNVAGTVDLDGKPLSSGAVIFQNTESEEGIWATVTSGRFQFKKPVLVGEYKVSVQPISASPLARQEPQADAPKIPIRYQNSHTSQLYADINYATDSLQFELTSE